MGKKNKAHRAKVAKRNRVIERFENAMIAKLAILRGIRERGFASVDEALEKAPGIFSELFPGMAPEQIRKILEF